MVETTLPPLRETIEEFEFNAKKSLGQHFLLDLNITRKIVREAGIEANDFVLEVGPGPGGLTRAVMETGAELVAIDKDRRCHGVIDQMRPHYTGNIELVEADALKVIEQEIIAKKNGHGTRVRLVSNLPYNISTELLIKWLKASPRWWTSLTLMFQKEVADRILAPHGNKTYGRLSVIAQATSTPRKCFDLPARAFTPPPKVQSTVVHFEPDYSRDFKIEVLEKITAAAFSQRRKMLRASLKPLLGASTEDVLESVKISAQLRAEQVTVQQFIELTKAVDS